MTDLVVWPDPFQKSESLWDSGLEVITAVSMFSAVLLVVTRQPNVSEEIVSIEEAKEENSRRSSQLYACFLLVKTLLAFYGIRRLYTVFTSVHHWSVFWGGRIQLTTYHPVYLRSILILSACLRLDFLSVSFRCSYRNSVVICSLPCMLYGSPISSSLIWSYQCYLATSMNYEAPQCAVFSIFLVVPPSKV
jgi:hypothetical protein